MSGRSSVSCLDWSRDLATVPWFTRAMHQISRDSLERLWGVQVLPMQSNLFSQNLFSIGPPINRCDTTPQEDSEIGLHQPIITVVEGRHQRSDRRSTCKRLRHNNTTDELPAPLHVWTKNMYLQAKP